MALNQIKIAKSEKGQATTEYILIISAIVSIFMTISNILNKMDLPGKLSKAMTGPFSAAYQYGDPTVKGFDNGGPIMHPRVDTGGNFRIFIDPALK